MSECTLCPRKCKAERTDSKNIGGFCKMPALPRIAKASLHFWEEPVISGKSGSGTVFFSGCSLGCRFCQNYKISHEGFGKTVSLERLATIFKELETKGAHNINLVNPTHYVSAIKGAVGIYKPKIPMVYNSGGYDSEECINNGFTDVYLLDLKYIDAEKAVRYGAPSDYFEVASQAVKRAYSLVGAPQFNSDGMMIKGVIVRHMLLPMNTRDAIRIIDWLKENCPDVIFSFMSQYTPFGDIENYPELKRRVTEREYNKVLDYLSDMPFHTVFTQDFKSSREEYIPDFDLEGV